MILAALCLALPFVLATADDVKLTEAACSALVLWPLAAFLVTTWERVA